MASLSQANEVAIGLEETVAAFVSSAAHADARTWPNRHWRLAEPLPWPLARALEGLPIEVAPMSHLTGRRDENNESRVFFDPAMQDAYPECQVLAACFQDARTIDAISTMCAIALGDTYLRIEYTRDTDGFWLEPHTDIGAKRFTMQIYLSSDAQARQWGTDLYAGPAEPPVRVPFHANHALVFVPGDESWHGFEKRPIEGVRRTLIVNYVGSEWRSCHELCFPDRPVR